MTAYMREWAQLRVGATVTLRDWQGATVLGAAFLSSSGDWLMRTPGGAVFPVLPRELIRVENGAADMFAKLREGASVTFADWEARKVQGVAHYNPGGVWEARSADGARWLLEPYRLISVQEG